MRQLPIWVGGPVARSGPTPASGSTGRPTGVPPLTRRRFLARSALCAGTVWLLYGLPHPLALRAARQSRERLVLTEEEWELVEAITGRIIPTDHEPGAIEADCVNFIDKALVHEEAGLREAYAAGLQGVDGVAVQRFGQRFLDLETDQQDAALRAIESGNVQEWPDQQIAPRDFFHILCTHTVIGFLADPSYGGNRDYVGWKVIGYPGPMHASGGYTTEQMIGTERIRTVWGAEVD